MIEMTVAPIIDFGNGFKINLANERWQTQGFRLAVAGSSGSGKSYLTSILVEELNGIGVPFLIVDPDGEYQSLRQIPGILLAARREGDIHLNWPNTGWIAQCLKALEQGQGVIVDISELDTDDQRWAYTRLLQGLWDRQRARRSASQHQAMVLIVEEAHLFAPQKRAGEAAQSLEITVTIARRGRKHGINTVFVSQRPGDLEKDVLGQSNVRVIMRLDLEHDFSAVKTMLPKGIKHETVLSLTTGEFFLRIGPDFHRVQRVRARRVVDLGQTPALVYRQREMFAERT